jgi:DNA invertase Pin-like site-specific DNA recombinase
MKNAIGYARVSTVHQTDGASLAQQERTIRSECERRGWHVAQVVKETASAKDMNRPLLKEALDELKTGKADVLVCPKLDRLTRSVKHTCEIGEMAEEHGFDLVFCDASIDTSTPHGKAQLRLMAVFSELERELIGQRTKEALSELKAQGKRLGRPVAIGGGTVARISELRDSGLSYAKVAAQLEAEDIPTPRGGDWRASTVHSVINRA